MLHNDIGRLPVVDRNDPGKLIGYIGRTAVMEARLRRMHEERIRQPGWIKGTPSHVPPADKPAGSVRKSRPSKELKRKVSAGKKNQ
jgi:hypothetical protein